MYGLARSPPVVGLALSAGAGVALFHSGAALPWILPPSIAFLLLKSPSRRPAGPRAGLVLALLAGFILSHSWVAEGRRDCRLLLRESQRLVVAGRLVGPLDGGMGEIHPQSGSPGPCLQRLRFVVPGLDAPRANGEAWRPGVLLRLGGLWRKSRFPGNVPPLRAGYLRVDSVDLHPAPSGSSVSGRMVTLGGWVQNRLAVLFPETAGMASALVWARKEGLDPSVREDFARAGTAHLLAISGFHVGVIAGLLLLLLGHTGLPHSARFLMASGGVWVYVVAIGIPDAAFRAALLLTIVSLGRMGNRPVAPLGAIATAFLTFLAADPGALLRPGFQLSFAGAFGLVVGIRPLSRWLALLTRGRMPSFLCQGLAAGLAATLATLPLVAWHFGRISLVGIPVTLLATPMVAFVIPGIFLSLLLSLFHLGLARFVSAGVELPMRVLLDLMDAVSNLPFAAVGISHSLVLSGVLAAALALFLPPLRFSGTRSVPLSPGTGRTPLSPGARSARFRRVAFMTAAGLMIGPGIARVWVLGQVEMVVLDVGQGDAVLLRSPGGRWLLVDAGPRTAGFDSGEARVLPYLRRRGIRRLELLILTHPDMDHVGGASSVLRGVPVGAVLDPGEPAGSQVFLDALNAAREREVPWRVADAGDSLNLDGLALRVLAPEPLRNPGDAEGNNASSLVLEVRFGEFSALLTGDAPMASEARFLRHVLSPRVSVLKVAHHGSATSTSWELLERTRPEMALISVGRRNRFGHPDPEVLLRLRQAGTPVLRTDRGGKLVVRAREDGSFHTVVDFP